MKTTTTHSAALRLLAALFSFLLLAPMAAGQDGGQKTDESNPQESNPTHSTYTIGLRPPSYVTDPSSTDFADVITNITIGGKTVTLSGKADGLVSFDATDIKPGESVDISVTVKIGYDYVVKSILMGTKELKVKDNGKFNFTATFAAPEDKNVAFTIVVVKLAVVNVYIANSPVTPGVTFILQNAQKYTYDKQKHGLEYTTDPSGLSLDILYKSTSLSGNEYYTTDVPIAAGKYNVKISRKADDYKEIPVTVITTFSGEAIIIEPAAIAITTPPTVTAKYDSQTGRYKFVLEGGVANALGENVTNQGTFEVLDESTPIDINDPNAVDAATPYTDNLVPDGTENTYQNVAVRFKMNSNPNYYPAATRVRVLIGEATVEPDPDPPYVPIYYSVYLPQVEGASTDPGPGEYEVESWSTFRFYLTIDSAYSDSQPVVTTDRGETLVPRSSDGAYLVKYVRSDVEVFIDGLVQNPPPVANEAISANALVPQIWAEGTMLCIRMPEALPSAPVRIFTADGRQHAGFASTPGLNRRPLPTGIYIVRAGDTACKVIVK